MRWPIMTLILCTACSQEGNNLGTPALMPLDRVGAVLGTDASDKQRGQVEIVVKSNYEEIKNDIYAGGGPALTKAMDAAGVPERDRPTRIIQLQSDIGLHSTSPGALVTALMLYGS